MLPFFLLCFPIMKDIDSLITYFEGFITEERKSRMDEILDKRTRYITTVLEDIYQSHNISAVLRSCDCFGINDVHIIENKNEFVLNKEIELGASSWLNIIRHQAIDGKIEESIQNIKEKGYRIIATSPHGNSNLLKDFDLQNGPVAIFFGTEYTGLSNEVFNLCDDYLKIPLYGFTESLNISVSAAIILNHLYSKLITSNIKWKLKEEEKKEIKLKWLRSSIKSANLLEKEYFNKQK